MESPPEDGAPKGVTLHLQPSLVGGAFEIGVPGNMGKATCNCVICSFISVKYFFIFLGKNACKVEWSGPLNNLDSWLHGKEHHATKKSWKQAVPIVQYCLVPSRFPVVLWQGWWTRYRGGVEATWVLRWETWVPVLSLTFMRWKNWEGHWSSLRLSCIYCDRGHTSTCPTMG